MTIHFEWKVLFHTIEAQLVYSLRALRSAEVPQGETLRRAHPLFGICWPASDPLRLTACSAAVSRTNQDKTCPVASRAEQSYFICLPVLHGYQMDFTFDSLYEIGGKIYAGLSLFHKLLLASRNSVCLSGGGGYKGCKLRRCCSNPANQHKALRILFLLQLQVTAIRKRKVRRLPRSE